MSRVEIAAAGSALHALQRGLTGDRRLAGSGYMDDPELLGAYLLYYWPVSYMQASLALAELPPAPRAPTAVLDLGSGPGPLAAAVLDAVGGTGQPVEELVLADASGKALGLAGEILERGDSRPARLRLRELDLESDATLPEGPFDLIVMGHCLNELWLGAGDARSRRLGLLERAAGRLAPDGRMLVLEPALLSTCRELLQLRDLLAATGRRVIAPCPGSYPCPILAAGPERSCHAEAAWAPPEPVASLAEAAGLDRSSVKHGYFAIAADQGPEARDAAGRRVVSDPMLNKAGRLRYILCGEGRLETLSAPANDGVARAYGFMSLARGDFIRCGGLEERPGGGLGLGPGSTLEITSRAPEAS